MYRYLHALKDLYLSDNKLATCPHQLATLTNLEVISRPPPHFARTRPQAASRAAAARPRSGTPRATPAARRADIEASRRT